MTTTQQFVMGTGPVLPPEVDTDTVSTILNWGNSSVATTAVTRFMSPFTDGILAPTVEIVFAMPRAAILRNLFVRNRLVGAGVVRITYTVRVNFVNTLLLTAISPTALNASNVVDVVNVNQGDLISLTVTKPAIIVTSPTDIQVTLEAA